LLLIIASTADKLFWAVAYLPLGHLGHAPPFELQKNLTYGKKVQPKYAIFRQKSPKFSLLALPALGREIPLTRPLTLGAPQPSIPSNFSQFL